MQSLSYLAYMSLQPAEPIHAEDEPQLQRAKSSSQRNLPVLQDRVSRRVSITVTSAGLMLAGVILFLARN